MIIQAIKTRKLIPPKDNIWEVLENIVPKLKENMIVAVTSKIVSISEGRCIPIDQITDKDELVKKEAEMYLERDLTPGGYALHTIIQHTLAPTAGIDASNAKDHYILRPKDPMIAAKKIWQFLTKRSGVKNLGVIITDSHSIPMRWGITGISLGFFGFEPLIDYRGKKDLFDREIKVSTLNIPDSLASGAVFAMGEGSEQTPIAIISDLPKPIKFNSRLKIPSNPKDNFFVPLEFDLYKPIIESAPWKKGGRHRK